MPSREALEAEADRLAAGKVPWVSAWRALQKQNRVVALASGDARSLRDRADLLMHLGWRGRAARDLRQTVALAPDNDEAHFAFAQALAQSRHLSAAKRREARALALRHLGEAARLSRGRWILYALEGSAFRKLRKDPRFQALLNQYQDPPVVRDLEPSAEEGKVTTSSPPPGHL